MSASFDAMKATNSQSEPSHGQSQGQSRDVGALVEAPVPRKRKREDSVEQRTARVGGDISNSGRGEEPCGDASHKAAESPTSREVEEGSRAGPTTPRTVPASFFPFVVDSSKPLGATALSPSEDEHCTGSRTLWKVSSVETGGQAEELGMKVGQYIYSLKGMQLKTEDDLQELLAQAKRTSDQYNLVLTDKPFVCEGAFEASKSQSNETPSKSPFHTFDFASFSVVPTANGTGTIDYGNLRSDLRKRVRAVCADLCLLPDDKRPWLDFALNLVFSSLTYEAINPASKTNIIDERCWLLGVKPKLKGPQPWMATRKFIVSCVKEMLEAEDNSWIGSTERRQLLKEGRMPLIKEHLVTWKSVLSQPKYSDLLETYAERVWDRFSLDHFGGGGISVMHRLTEYYVCIVANKLEERAMCPNVPGVGNLSSDQPTIDTSSLKSLISKHLAKLRFEIIPFTKDVNAVAEDVFQRLQDSFVSLQQRHASPINSVREILDDLEDDSNYLTRQNEMHKVRLKLSALTPNETLRFVGSDVASCGEDDDIFSSNKNSTVLGRDTDGQNAAQSGAGTSAKQSETRDETLGDDTPEQKEKTTRVYSSVKDAGSRVYAEFTNGDYYWGKIINVRKSKAENKFEVLFEDGDILDNIPEKHVFTEVEYIEIFNNEPPPQQETDRERRNRSRSGSRSRSQRREKKKRRRSRRDSALSDKGSNDGTTEPEKTSALLEVKLPEVSEEFMEQYVGQKLGNWSTRKLYSRRCKRCVMCTKPDCGLCSTCKLNEDEKKESSKEVCLRKMCCAIEPRRKAQPAVGFSPGWMFYFKEQRKASTIGISNPQTSCPGLHIIAPDGGLFRSVEGAASLDGSAQIDVESMCQLFRDHVGSSQYHVDPNHVLFGKGYCHEWTDIHGRNNVVFGVISRCSREGGGAKFTVDYDDNSVAVLNNAPGGSAIKRSQEIPSELAWGGCIAFERKNRILHGPNSIVKNIDRTAPCKTWITPTMRKEELVDRMGVMLPQLTLVVRGFKLVFTVKESTIPNAGYGVFVKCTSLRNDISSKTDNIDEAETFKLKGGELLDLGVCSPFRAEDKKHRSVFNLKAYVFSMECEGFCYETPEDDYVYDNTNDKSGKVRGFAKVHVPAFVNECSAESVPTIHVDHDPEGKVHYLLGIAYRGDWDEYRDELKQALDLKVDGDELEVFVNYGADYEAVRIRKGYSALPKESRKEKMLDAAKREAGFVGDIDHYDAKEIAMSVDFFLKRCIRDEDYHDYTEENPIDAEVRDRALKVSRKLRDRARTLLERVESANQEAQQEATSTDHANALKQTLESADVLIERLTTISCDSKMEGFDGVQAHDSHRESEDNDDDEYDVCDSTQGQRTTTGTTFDSDPGLL